MKYLLQFQVVTGGIWHDAHEAESYDEVYLYWDCNSDEFPERARIVKVEFTVLAELQ